MNELLSSLLLWKGRLKLFSGEPIGIVMVIKAFLLLLTLQILVGCASPSECRELKRQIWQAFADAGDPNKSNPSQSTADYFRLNEEYRRVCWWRD